MLGAALSARLDRGGQIVCRNNPTLNYSFSSREAVTWEPRCDGDGKWYVLTLASSSQKAAAAFVNCAKSNQASRYANLLSIPRSADLRDDSRARSASWTWPQIAFSIFVLRVFESFCPKSIRKGQTKLRHLLCSTWFRWRISLTDSSDPTRHHHISLQRLAQCCIWLACLGIEFVYGSGHGERNVKLALPRHTGCLCSLVSRFANPLRRGTGGMLRVHSAYKTDKLYSNFTAIKNGANMGTRE